MVDLVLGELLPRAGEDEDAAGGEEVHADGAVLAVRRDLPVALQLTLENDVILCSMGEEMMNLM